MHSRYRPHVLATLSLGLPLIGSHLARMAIGPLCDRYGPRITYTLLLALGSIPVFGIAFAWDYTSFLVFRLLIGIIGASFVITQYHTSVMFAPNVVGIYYMAQQVASLPQRLKTSFDPILGPVVTRSIARGDLGAIARQVRDEAAQLETLAELCRAARDVAVVVVPPLGGGSQNGEGSVDAVAAWLLAQAGFEGGAG